MVRVWMTKKLELRDRILFLCFIHYIFITQFSCISIRENMIISNGHCQPPVIYKKNCLVLIFKKKKLGRFL